MFELRRLACLPAFFNSVPRSPIRLSGGLIRNLPALSFLRSHLWNTSLISYLEDTVGDPII